MLTKYKQKNYFIILLDIRIFTDYICIIIITEQSTMKIKINI